MFPNVVLGLSDHTPGHAAVLGAVALGARVVEKHFTDDTTREGPDHGFSMNPDSWRDMVDRTRELERALGSAEKFVAENEQQTVILQRRCLRAARSACRGDPHPRDDHRTAPGHAGALLPTDLDAAVGTRVLRDLKEGQELRWTDLGAA